MSNSYFALADLVKINDKNAVDNGITDLLNKAPALKVMQSTTASNGTNHRYIKETSAPTVGFRAVNTGKALSTDGITEVSVTLQNIDATTVNDTALANGYKGGPAAFQQGRAVQALKQAFFVAEQQIWYGTGAGASTGFSGLGDDSHYNALAGTLTVNAGGTTAATGSSVWLIRSVPDDSGVAVVLGNEGNIEIGDTVQVWKTDDTTPTSGYAALMTPIQAYVGLQIGGVYSAVRIGNLTADSGKGLTDAVISTAINLFPAGEGPTMIVMNRRSLGQLQKSRTATNPTGQPAPYPQDSFGIDIVVTDSIISTEPLLV
jgi:hypothetical protein